MKRYRVALAMRSVALPHVDTTAQYHVDASSITNAINRAVTLADREGMPVGAIRRVTCSLARTVAP